MTVSCHSCGHSFADYGELARHIASTKKGHRQGKRWAAKYLLRTRSLDTKKTFEGRAPITQANRENRDSIVRELSGETEYVLAVCPRCHKGHRELLPVEFTQSGWAWRQKNCVVVMCPTCQ